MSLDGYIAGPTGEVDYLISDPSHDSRAFFARVDTVLMGRRTYEAAVRQGASGFPGMRAYVFSRMLRPSEHPDVRVVAHGAADVVRALRAEAVDRDIWLAGGGDLLGSLLAAGVVDTVEVGVSPVLLGRPGAPILAPTAALPVPQRLGLESTHAYPSGLVVLEYRVLTADAVRGDV